MRFILGVQKVCGRCVEGVREVCRRCAEGAGRCTEGVMPMI